MAEAVTNPEATRMLYSMYPAPIGAGSRRAAG